MVVVVVVLLVVVVVVVVSARRVTAVQLDLKLKQTRCMHRLMQHV